MAAVFERVVIDLSGGGTAVLKSVADSAGKIVRLHELVLGMASAGTVTIEEGGGGDLSGDINMAANGTLVIPFRDFRDACLQSGSGHGMQVTTSQAAAGYAIISTDTN